MDSRAIALAIPFFFLLIAVELAVLRARKRTEAYVFADSIASLACGVGQQALAVLAVDGVKIAAYAAIWTWLRVTTIEPSVVTWAVLLVGVDLCYWLYHWASHRVNFFWATHVVHHQSEEYNLTTALRQSWFSSLTAWIFYAPLAVAGFPPAMFVVMTTVNTLYQFWIHTRTIGTLGPLEWFMNTPSHHRVHHGTNPRYLDANYAGIFIVWDKLFRTFSPETGEPVYGTVKPLSSWNAAWANVEPFVRLWEISKRTRRVRDKIWIWLAPPEWFPEDLGGKVVPPEVTRDEQEKFATPVGHGLTAYVVVQFALVAGALSTMLWMGEALPVATRAAIVGWVLVALAAWGGLLEGRGWGTGLELSRLASTAPLAWVAVRPLGDRWALQGAVAAGAVGIASALLLLRADRAPAEAK